MISISIGNPYEIPLDFATLKDAARTVLEGEGIPSAKIVIAFVNNTHMHRLNKQYLDHDEPTDVLTFPYSGKGAKKLEGEIVIGYEVAEEYAADRGHAVEQEQLLYVIHGCLHLCGYNDTTEKTERQMRVKERYYLNKLGLKDITENL
jgi:probable rRNA maturation factor